MYGGGDMNISKKALVIFTAGVLSAVTICVTAVNAQNFKSFAGGITVNGNQRVLTLDNNAQLNINEGVGTLDIGNFRIYSPSCSSLVNGFVTLNTCELIIYCPNVAKTAASYHRGFAGSQLTSVEIVSNNRNTSFTPRVIWGRTSDGTSIETSETPGWNSFNKTGSNNNVTTTFTSSNGAFITSQDSAKSSGYTCLCISTKGSSNLLDLYSLTISFTCN